MVGFTKKGIFVLMLTMILFAPLFVSAQTVTEDAKSQGYHSSLHTMYLYNTYYTPSLPTFDFIGISQSKLIIGSNPASTALIIRRLSGSNFAVETGGGSGGGSVAFGSPISVNGDVDVTGNVKASTTVVANFAVNAAKYCDVNGNNCVVNLNSLGGGTPGVSLWTDSGADAYYADTGNVGIGKSNPLVKLDVVGTGSFSNNLYAGDTLYAPIVHSSNRVRSSLFCDTNGVCLNLSACANGQMLFRNSTGWTCAQNCATGQMLYKTATGWACSPTCTNGQILVLSGTNWVCANNTISSDTGWVAYNCKGGSTQFDCSGLRRVKDGIVYYTVTVKRIQPWGSFPIASGYYPYGEVQPPGSSIDYSPDAPIYFIASARDSNALISGYVSGSTFSLKTLDMSDSWTFSVSYALSGR